MRLTFATAVLAATVALAGCDERRASRLEEGLSTEVDVRREFGEPAEIVERTDRSRALSYPRQPEGATNYEVVIGADGKMTSLRQLLTPANFARVVPGMEAADVRRLLGRPAQVLGYALAPDESVWQWRYLDGGEKKVFEVTFDSARKVRRTARSDDLRQTSRGG